MNKSLVPVFPSNNSKTKRRTKVIKAIVCLNCVFYGESLVIDPVCMKV